MKCNHEWKSMKDGSLDKYCVRCCKKAMQGQLSAPATQSIKADMAMPAGREKVKVPHYTGDKTVIVEVFRDDLIKQFNKSLNLSIINSPKVGG